MPDGTGDRRLIEEWLPIAALGEESVRERRSMTALPPTYYLHVWWARRPLVASRAAIMGALLPAGADKDKFMHILGIHGDPIQAKVIMEKARRTGDRYDNPYGYNRAFTYSPLDSERTWLRNETRRLGLDDPMVLDPTAGGGSIPFEAVRLGLSTSVNDLNPVAWLVLKTTVEFPATLGSRVGDRLKELGDAFLRRVKERVQPLYPESDKPDREDATYLWARTVTCPYCGGVVPLSPNWRLDGSGTGVRLIPLTNDPNNRLVRFEIVTKAAQHSEGTVNRGNGLCPFPDCGRVIDGDEIKAQAQAGRMGDQLYAIVYKEEKVVTTKAGRSRMKKVRGFRAPRPEDDVRDQVDETLAEKMPGWQARGLVPDEERYIGPADRSANYGMLTMTDLFSPRQLYGHCTSVEVFQELMAECGGPDEVSDLDRAALCYLALANDKMLNYNARMVRWHANREVVAGVFDRHDFSFKWSYAEMAPTITGLGYDWAIKQTGKALKELVQMVRTEGDMFAQAPVDNIEVFCGPGDQLREVADATVDAVVMDPPYYDNVMYAELADFFYVWLKRTAGLLFPEPFMEYLTDKEREAVANVAKFADFTKVRGSGGAGKRAARDYRERMQAIFTECRRALKPEGIMVLMFTHKASGAWDALATGLLEAGFTITASWPVNTEAEGSLHIKEKNAAKSTIFLVCRPRGKPNEGDATTYWEDVEPKVASVVKERVQEFQDLGIGGVDLYLSCFGPALEVFSKHWPMQRGRAMQRPEIPKGSQLKLIEDEEWDPYAVRPEDALMAARTAVKEWRLDQLASVKRRAHLDLLTEFYVMAWDAFGSPQFPADEALKLSRVVGISFDQKLRNRVLEVKGSEVILWDSALRAEKGVLGSLDRVCMLDALHHTARIGRTKNTGAAKDALERVDLLDDETYKLALETLMNVLPTPRLQEGKGPVAGAAADCGALEKLRQLVYSKEIPQPKHIQLELEV